MGICISIKLGVYEYFYVSTKFGPPNRMLAVCACKQLNLREQPLGVQTCLGAAQAQGEGGCWLVLAASVLAGQKRNVPGVHIESMTCPEHYIIHYRIGLSP